jgi:hypothetical protein
MKNIAIISGILMFITFSCEKNKNDEINLKVTDTIITTGAINGSLCAGSDSLTIAENRVLYDYLTSCNSGLKEKSQALSKKEWNDLVKSFDMKEFTKIDLNSCDACFDGVDHWIYVKEGNTSHRIRYGYRDSLAMKPINDFVDRLSDIRKKF